MIQNFKILGQTAPSANVDTFHYQVPYNSSTVIRSINITNTSATPDTYNISFVPKQTVDVVVNTTDNIYTSVIGTQIGFYSTDTISWTTTTLPIRDQWNDLNFKGNIFFTNGYTYKAYSTNGLTWTLHNNPIFSYNLEYINGFYCSNDQSGTGMPYSTDGITWSTITLPSPITAGRLTAGNNIILNNSYSSANAAYSTNGITWTAIVLPDRTSAPYYPDYRIFFANNMFISLPKSYPQEVVAITIYSTNGITWNTNTTGISINDWSYLKYGNNKFVALKQNYYFQQSTAIAYSTNGITWSYATVPFNATWYGLSYGNNAFLINNRSTSAAYSTDGVTWNVSTLPATIAGLFTSSYFNGTYFVVVGGRDQYYSYSTNGITWSLRFVPTNSVISSATFGSVGAVTTSPSSSSNYIQYNNTVNGKSTVSLKSGYTLENSSIVRVKSTNGTSTFSSYGVEQS
jgi:hypothetical protein